jgi:hypothetical protein
MSSNFNRYGIDRTNKRKYNFDLSHKNIFDMKAGDVVPFLFMDVVPGDEFNMNTYLYGKSAPLVAPQMSEVNVNVRYFFVPWRLIMKNWHEFYIGGDNTNYKIPRISFGDLEEYSFFANVFGNLYRHFGLPESSGIPNDAPQEINLMPLRAYQQIYYYYYLNSGLFTESELETIKESMCENETEEYSTFASLMAAEGKFFPNSGDTDFNGYYPTFRHEAFYSDIKKDAQIPLISQGTTIKDFKIAEKIQQMYETVISAKNRFMDYSAKVFGIAPRLEYDRPIYLGGKETSTFVNEVEANTAATGQPLGSFAGKMNGFNDAKAKFTATEFGYLVGLVDITPRVQQHSYLHSRMVELEPLDMFHPELQNTYVEEIPTKYAHMDFDGTVLGNNATYGFTMPYPNLRHERGYTVGDMKGSLKFWNILEEFNQTIYQGNMNNLFYSKLYSYTAVNYWLRAYKEILAVQDEAHFYVQAFNTVNARRIVKPNISKILESA